MRLTSPELSLFFPFVFPSETTLKAYPFLYVIYCIEGILLIFSTAALFGSCRSLSKSQLFHRNLIYVAQFHLCSFYFSSLGHIVIVLHTIGIFYAEGDIRSNRGLVAACFVTQWCRCSSLSVFPSVMLERYYASHFVADYEAKPRKWVASLVITVSCIFTTATTIPLISALITYTICPVVYISLYRRDKKQVRHITSPLCTNYLLSARFQLAENLRVMKIVMYSSIVYSIWLIPPCIIMFLTFLYFKTTSAAGQICYAAYEIFVSISVLLLLVYTVVKSGGYSLTCCLRTSEHHKVRHVDKHDNIRTTSMYFQQLIAAWKY